VQHVSVRVPASTSNLGPGFDCLGVALRIYNKVHLRRDVRSTSSSIVNQAATRFFKLANCAPFEFSCAISGDVPVARGLGSSASVRLGVLHGLNALAGTKFTRDELFALAAELEGHPDNAAPASFGGFTVTCGGIVQRFVVASKLSFVLLIPNSKISTPHARALLPQRIPHSHAVLNVANTAAVVAAFAAGDYEKLRGTLGDALHQPYRKKLMPFFDDVVEAATNAGALGAFLSGSGSAICAITMNNEQKIGRAMRQASHLENVRIAITHADNHGARLQSSSNSRRQPDSSEWQTSNMR
jgi:homoserine kinase